MIEWKSETMKLTQLIDEYAAGPQKLRDSIAGMTPEQIDAAPVPGKWSTRALPKLVCSVSAVAKVIATFVGCELVQQLTDAIPESFYGSFC